MSSNNPLDGFVLNSADFAYIGHDLQRPECILAERDGTLWSADARGGVVRIDADGSQEIISQSRLADQFETQESADRFVNGTLPNGLAFDRNGDILISNFGTDCLERMSRTGDTTVILDSVNGDRIGKVNFVCRDSKDRIWITISTMIHDWPSAISPNIRDGRVLLYEEGIGVRVVADGIHFSNECKLDAQEEYLYVAQTAGRNVVRFRIEEDGSLTNREIFGPADHGRLIDGITFDSVGNLWGTHVFADGIWYITPEAELRYIYDDVPASEVRRLDDAFQRDRVTTDLLMSFGGPIATWCASITFGGPDLKTVYVGSLRQTCIPYFRSPVAGLPLAHWNE